jgi:hypothetical protein
MREGWQRDVLVQCYAGYRGEEEPRQFTWKERNLDVRAIMDRWLDPSHRYFKVRASDGRLYLLRHDNQSAQWMLRVLQA